MSRSYTRSESFSWTEAKVRYLMQKVLADLTLLVGRGVLSSERGTKWHSDISFLLLNRAVESFEFQITMPSGRKCGLRYQISDGVLSLSDLEAGGLDLWWIPAGSMTGVVVSYREDFPNREAVLAEMKRRGWVSGGTLMQGAGVHDRDYSRGGVGLRRNKVGDWND